MFPNQDPKNYNLGEMLRNVFALNVNHHRSRNTENWFNRCWVWTRAWYEIFSLVDLDGC